MNSTATFRVIRTAGLEESLLSEIIGGWPYDKVKLAYLPKYSGVDLRISAVSAAIGGTEGLLDQAERYLESKVGDFIYGQGETELAEAVGKILKARNWRLSAAESCTGGLLGSMITDIPGASDYFEGGFITYSNEAKINQLGVPAELIQEHGAVSAEVALKMAEGATERTRSQFGLSITGIAGPSGGSAEKPVGTTFIAVAHPEGVEVSRFNFQDDRLTNRRRAAYAALSLLFKTIKRLDSQ